MRITQSLFRTQRSDPGEAETPSHRLLLKSGMVQQVAAGIYSYGPLAQRSLTKIQTIIREEMDAAGGLEVKLPALQPRELWQTSGRDQAFGPDLLRLEDRRGRAMVMAPTHEETVTLLARQFIQSYRDLPRVLYQIQTKFRDEPRPRAGLIRVREFDMKDAYSFDADEESLDRTYQRMVQAYRNIFGRCGLPVVLVEADSGAIGGKDSHEFILPTPVGEDVMLQCPGCGYAANVERAVAQKPFPVDSREEPLPLEEVHTPNTTTIEAVADYLGIPTSKTLKAVFYWVDGQVVFATIRGDLTINEIKLKRALNAQELRPATDAEVAGAGLVAGYASPIGLERVRTVADDSVQAGSNFVVGANKPQFHLRNANYPRDFQVDLLADIAAVQEGHPCLHCGTALQSQRGIEVGHVFKLGTFFSETLGLTYLGPQGAPQPSIMGCYGIGVGRLLAASIEQHHDDKGMYLPPAVAPYQVYLAALNVENAAVVQAAEDMYARLTHAGAEVLFDDRGESAGVKLNDADLMGFPVRVVVSPRTLRSDAVEVKARTDSDATTMPIEDAPAAVQAILAR